MSKPPQKKADLGLREKAISRLVDSDSLNDESLLKLVEILGQDGVKSPEEVANTLQARAERRRRWWDLPAVAAVATAVSGLVTIALQGGVDVWKQREVALQEFRIEDMKLTRAAFEKLMYVDPEAYLVFSADSASASVSDEDSDPELGTSDQPTSAEDAPAAVQVENETPGEQGLRVEPTASDGEAAVSANVSDSVRKGFLEWAEIERRNRLCVAVDFGVIRIPDEFLQGFDGGNSYEKVKAFMKDYECDRGTLPTEAPLVAASSASDRASLSGCERVLLELGDQLLAPLGLDARNPNHIALLLAIDERNLGVHETECSQRLDHYWNALNLQLRRDENTPWGAVFTSYLLQRSGNPANIRLSALHSDIWTSATIAGKSTVGINGIQVGDLIFRIRSSGPYPNEAELVRAIHAGEYKGAWTGFSGVVYSISQERQEVTVIGGNVTNMVREVVVKLDDTRIVGFVRQ